MDEKTVSDSGISAIEFEDATQEAPYKKSGNRFSKYESLEYYYTGNYLVKEERIRLNTSPKFLFFLSLLININIGIFTSVLGTLLAVAIKNLLDIKFHLTREAIKTYGATVYMFIPILCHVSTSAVPVIASSILVTYVEPMAAGAGVVMIKAYLNGVDLKKGLRLKTLLVKFAGVLLATVGGLPGGNEATMLQSGGIVGAQICDFISAHPLKSCQAVKHFRHEFYKKDFVLAGIAAGVGCGYAAPIAGTIVPLEQATSFWSFALIVKILMASTTSAFIATVLKSYFFKGNYSIGIYSVQGIEAIRYEFFEIPIFALMGVIGGLFSSLWNEINFRLNLCRSKFLKSKWMKVLEAGLFSILYSTIGYIVLYLAGDCVVEEPQSKMLHCGEGEKNTMEKFLFEPPSKIVRDLFYLKERDEPKIKNLVIFYLIYFIGTSIANGLSITMGNFSPLFLLGAVWGRCIGEVGKKYIRNARFINPGKYALIGAAAQIAGGNRITISITVILVEITGMTPEFVLPLIAVIMCAKWTGDFLIGDRYTRASRLPILPWHLPTCAINRQVEEIMNKPAVCFLIQEKASYVYEVLKNTTHNGYPVVQVTNEEDRSNGLLYGAILRENLFFVLQERFFEERKDEWIEDVTEFFLSSKYDSRNMFNIRMPLPEEADFTIDMTPFMGPCPVSVISKAYVPQIYGLFRSLGLRRIVVTDDMNRVVGIVTRKDFFCEP